MPIRSGTHAYQRILAGIAFGALALTSAADEAWRLEKNAGDVQIYSRAAAGWNIREIRGTTRIDASLAAVTAVLMDIEASPQLNEFVAKAQVQERESATRYRVYSTMKMPWPISDRDILNQRELIQNPDTREVIITDIATRGLMAPQQGLLRIVDSRQQWSLKPLPEGGVDVEMRLLADPAGTIPSRLIDAMAVSTPLKTLRKLRELAQRTAYANAKLDYLR